MRKMNKKRTITNACRPSIKPAATVHEMGHYPSMVYHYVVDKSMSLTVMILRYSKHKALRRSRCTVSTVGSEGALGARVLIALRGVSECVRARV